MKKRYFLFVSVFALMFSTLSFGQAADNFDSYTAGQLLACQNPTGWTTWTNNPCLAGEDAVVSNAFALSAPNSVKIVQNNDLVKLLGDKTAGTWYLSFNFYIPTGKAGYFNMLSDFVFTTGGYWAFECYFDAGGSGHFIANHNGTAGTPFTWNQAAWNFAQVRVDLNANQAQFTVNGNVVMTWPWTEGSSTGTGTLNIDAVDFFGATANDEMYFDNFWFDMVPVPVELTSFTANAANGNVTLNWQTASEINNRGFEIERRTADGQFVVLGFVQGYGTTTQTQNYTFVDNNVQSNSYVYRLRQVDFDGRFAYSPEVEVEAIGAVNYTLNQNYPNPFNPSTIISYSIPEAGTVKLAVFNMLGEEVAILFNGQQEVGNYQVTFDAKQLPSGSYFYKLESGSFVEAKKMLLTK
jgi:hypothetical protein